ncbi:agmatine deiminase [Bacillus sp. JJ1764]|uniref:agmatine deiminase n=1 Tax=Bacillus sp. JJ1764 TaxID=3122964 RepID=UPI002FFF7AFD
MLATLARVELETVTPKSEGFKMPGEYELHEGCWMIWPERGDNWRYGGYYAQKAFVEVAKAISRFEKVTMCVSPENWQVARGMLPEHIRVIEMTNNDSWMRDVGPSFVVNNGGEIRGVSWDFNAWGGLRGGLYFPWDQDDLVAAKVCDIEGKALYYAPFVLEGGSIHVDGEGTCITTEECLLNPNRNPDLTKEQIEYLLEEFLGVEKVIWIPRGVYNDETNGHVDNLLCYVRPGEVALTWTDDINDPQYAISREAYDVLANTTDAKGRRLKIHTIYQPNPIIITPEEAEGVHPMDGTMPRQAGDRLAGSYINHYIANGGVVMPLFNDPHDELAMTKLQEIYPDREIVGVYAREIILGGGNIHCITQQQPKGRI